MSDRRGEALLVLGASVHQLDVIRAAARRGLRVVVVDNVPANPGHRLADSSYAFSTTDVDQVERVARAEAVGGIVAACTDVAVPTAAIVADRLGLQGLPPATASLVTSKSAFRRWQRDAGFPYPEFLLVGAEDDLPGTGRWIVKPDRSSGSKGTRIAAGEAGLAGAFAAARGGGDGSGVVVERVIDGHHVTVEALLDDGRMAWSIVLDRQTADPPWCATVGHRVPTTLDPAQVDRAVGAVAEVAGELGLRDGPLDADLVIGAEPVVLEISPRLGGNGIVPLAELATGIRLADVTIDVALGRPMPEPPCTPPVPAAVVLLGVDAAGVLAYNEGEVAALRAEPWVSLLEIEPPGNAVRAFVDGRATVGRALVTAADRDGIDARAEEIRARVAAVAR